MPCARADATRAELAAMRARVITPLRLQITPRFRRSDAPAAAAAGPAATGSRCRRRAGHVLWNRRRPTSPSRSRAPRVPTTSQSHQPSSSVQKKEMLSPVRGNGARGALSPKTPSKATLALNSDSVFPRKLFKYSKPLEGVRRCQARGLLGSR